jgi:hypothetical protein
VRTRVLMSMALLFLCGFTVTAADISGKWHAQVPWPGRNLTDFYFAFKVDGGRLTGTVTYAVGDGLSRMEIIEGKVGADDVSFAVISTQRNTEVKWVFKGKVTGAVIPFTVEMPAAGAPGAPGAGAPGGPTAGTPGAAGRGTPGAPTAGTPGAPAASTPSAPAAGTPGAPAAGTPGGPGGGTPVVLEFTAKRGGV